MAKASVSTMMGASAEDLCAAVGEFGGITNWHPAIAKSELAPGTPGDQTGSIETCSLGDGAQWREEQTARSDAERTYTYSILESPMPVENYLSTVTVTPEGRKARLDWSCTFDVPAETETEMVGMMNGVYQAGVDALKKKFGG